MKGNKSPPVTTPPAKQKPDPNRKFLDGIYKVMRNKWYID